MGSELFLGSPHPGQGIGVLAGVATCFCPFSDSCIGVRLIGGGVGRGVGTGVAFPSGFPGGGLGLHVIIWKAVQKDALQI